jgi:hypothetical protein
MSLSDEIANDAAPIAVDSIRSLESPERLAGEFVWRTSFTRRMCLDPQLPEHLAEELWTNPDRLVAEGELLKHGGRTTVVRVEVRDRLGKRTPWLLKRYNLRGPLHTLVHFCLRSRARTSWLNGHRLQSLGITTPLPQAYLEHRIGPLLTRSFLVTEFIHGTNWEEALYHETDLPELTDDVLAELEKLWARLGEGRVSIGDARLANFLLTSDGRVWMIDLDSMRRHRVGLTYSLARRRDRARFLRDWQGAPHLEEVVRGAIDGTLKPAA